MASVGSGDSDNAESRAAAWVVRSSEGPLTAEDQQALDQWLASDTRNLGAWVKAQAAWLDVDRLVALDAGTTNEPVRVTKPLPWRKMAIAASMLFAIGMGVVAEDQLPGRIETARGEVRRVALADGSTMFVNGDTVLQVRFSDRQRRIVLRRGEASFKVAHDAARPFLVEAGDVSARAVGTDFTVGRAADGDIAVTVAEGRVKVTDAERGTSRQLVLDRDEQFVAATIGPRRARLDPSEVQRQLAWRRGQLIFRGQMLAAAAAEVNRHAAKPVVINDSSLGRAEFIGVFRVGDSRAFANAAAAAFNGEVSETPDAFVLARRQNSPSH
ncbi:FecR domain-containing protein [Sphingomonas sp.]|uniref:FecR family protein n=1 Tax=Sphingomonas sp. TaxID=28214 RepID=UPI0031D7CE11